MRTVGPVRPKWSCRDIRSSRENADPMTAMNERNAALTSMFQTLTGLPPARLAFTASHSTSVDALSRLSILTFAEPAIAGQVLRSAGQRRFEYRGSQLSLRRQTAAFDRICSAPAKISMEAISHEHKRLEKMFEPKWRDGLVYNKEFDPNVPIIKWTVDIEQAKIRLWIPRPYKEIVERAMDPGIRRLQFGAAADQDGDSDFMMIGGKSQKGRGKGGKGSKAKRTIPVDPGSFRKEQGIIKDGLGNLHFSKFPFTISIKEAEKEDRSSSSKRAVGSGPTEHAAKKRSPTPTRELQTQNYGGSLHGIDPWARAAHPAAPSPPASSVPAATAQAPSTSTTPGPSSELHTGTFSA